MLISQLAYSGERPGEALALEWRHVQSNTLLIEPKLVRGQIVAGQKTARSIRAIKLLGPFAQDLAEYRAQTGATGLLFPKPDDAPWLDHDFRNWRQRNFRPATEAIRLVAARP
jgi:integrase